MKTFKDAKVKAAFDAYPERARRTMMQLRALIFEMAASDEVGGVVETLKWGQPAYLPVNARAGTTIRLGSVRAVGALPDQSRGYLSRVVR